jgi:hypothetical protein
METDNASCATTAVPEPEHAVGDTAGSPVGTTVGLSQGDTVGSDVGVTVGSVVGATTECNAVSVCDSSRDVDGPLLERTSRAGSLVDAHTHACKALSPEHAAAASLAGAVLVSVDESEWDAVEARAAAMAMATSLRGTSMEATSQTTTQQIPHEHQTTATEWIPTAATEW